MLLLIYSVWWSVSIDCDPVLPNNLLGWNVRGSPSSLRCSASERHTKRSAFNKHPRRAYKSWLQRRETMKVFHLGASIRNRTRIFTDPHGFFYDFLNNPYYLCVVIGNLHNSIWTTYQSLKQFAIYVLFQYQMFGELQNPYTKFFEQPIYLNSFTTSLCLITCMVGLV